MTSIYPGKPKSDREFLQKSLDEQLEVVLRTRGSRKIDLIISSPHAIKLTRLLSEEDIYLTIAEVGEEDSLILFEMTNFRQAQFVYDLEWWDEGVMNPDRIVFWFSLMIESFGTKLIEWFKNSELETLIAVFQKLIHVHIFDNIDDLNTDPPQRYFFTLDNTFFIEFTNPDQENIISQVLSVLRANDNELYIALMQGIFFQLRSELEEMSANLREHRLEERGFSIFDEAMIIYQPLPKRKGPDGIVGDVLPRNFVSDRRSPRHAVTGQRRNLLLSRCFAELQDFGSEERIRYELSNLSNRIIVADGLKPDYETLQRVFKKAYGLVNIGLEVLSSEYGYDALEILKMNFIQNIFRVGYEPVHALHLRVHRLFSDLNVDGRNFWLAFLESPYMEIMESILSRRPRCRTYTRDKKMLVEKDFEDSQEILEIAKVVDEVELIMTLFRHRIGIALDVPDSLDSPMARFLSRDVSWKQLLNTMYIHYATEGNAQSTPLDPNQIPDFYETVLLPSRFQESELMSSETTEKFLQEIERLQYIVPEERQMFHRLLEKSMVSLVDLFDGVRPDREILSDPRLFPGLLFKQELT